MEFHERLRNFRENILHIGRSVLSEKLSVSPQTYGKYEKGDVEVSIGQLQTLASLGCNIDWLVTGKESPPAKNNEELHAANGKITALESEKQALESKIQALESKMLELEGQLLKSEERDKEHLDIIKGIINIRSGTPQTTHQGGNNSLEAPKTPVGVSPNIDASGEP